MSALLTGTPDTPPISKASPRNVKVLAFPDEADRIYVDHGLTGGQARVVSGRRWWRRCRSQADRAPPART